MENAPGISGALTDLSPSNPPDTTPSSRHQRTSRITRVQLLIRSSDPPASPQDKPMPDPEPPSTPEYGPLQPNEVLTQHGSCRADNTFRFLSHLRSERPKPELDVSVSRGRLTPNEAGSERTSGRRREADMRRDAARHTTVQRLRDSGFRVEYTPRRPASLRHVSIYWDSGTWDDEVAARFDACFDPPVSVRN
jgi:hypothetical protein